MNMAKAWDKISSSYQKRYAIGTLQMHWGPLCPSEKKLKLLGCVKGKRILEVGSGAGQNSIMLARNGAIVTALDISKNQINYGKLLAKKEKVSVNFIQGDFENINTYFADTYFDIAFSAYALQYCKTITSMQSTFKQINNILCTNGQFIFSLDHPLRTHGYWNKQNNFIFDNYFDSTLKKWDYSFPETKISAKMQGTFYTISEIINTLIDSGFFIEKILEPKPVKKDPNTRFGVNSRYGFNNKRDPFTYEHLSRTPGTLIIKARKNNTKLS